MGYVHNPVRRGCYPDPSVCSDGIGFYCVHSSFAYMPGIPVFQSTDLISWQQIGHVLTEDNMPDLGDIPVRGGIYAPTIRYHDGIFYCITTLVKKNNEDEEYPAGNFYVTATDPQGPWSAPHFLEGAEGIDPSLFFDGEDCWYVGQRQKEGSGRSGDCEIWIQRLDLTKAELIGEKYVLWDGAMKNAVWAEGPHLYQRDGCYYLMIAEGGTEFNHSICIARSGNLTGPYESCPANPIFTHRNLGKNAQFQNVGHGDLVETPAGDWYMLMLGTRPYNGYALTGRETFIADVTWEEDWPVINAGEGKLREWQKIDLSDTDCTQPLSRDVQWREPLDQRIVTLRKLDIFHSDRLNMKNGLLRLGSGSDSIVMVRMEEPVVRFSVRMEYTNLKVGESAGLTLFYDDGTWIRFGVLHKETHFEPYMNTLRGGGTFRHNKDNSRLQILKSDMTDCVLTILVKNGEATFKILPDHLRSSEEKTVDTVSTDFLSSEDTGGFTGCMLGVYCSAAPEETASESNGYAVFDTLQIRYQA